MKRSQSSQSFWTKKKPKKVQFRVPFSFSPIDKLKKRSVIFRRFVRYRRDTALSSHLRNSGVPITREEYLSICYGGFITSSLLLFVLASTFLIMLRIERALVLSLGLAILFGGFVYFSRVMYPQVYNNRKQRNIERNLIPALQDMLVQLHSGVPLFTILINLSLADYEELSEQFKKAVKGINAGRPQVEVLEDLGKDNPSEFFRKTLWQLSNGMRAGSDISIVIQDSIHSLSEEQFIQIQEYGNKLNPVIMFYMLSSVILPALAITFLTIITSMIGLSGKTTQMMFLGLFVAVLVLQVMFLGVIKSVRPSLL
ncbi:MAG: type II secretion system F family protein [Nanoarchaeota archaeon]|nr:type II secretion system F family protein [Nanoarchaeota archaeon]MBU0977357.1 type II secretion system F family protein [Nanoarchaeota archaeon]